jgi:methylthioribulose-1-phosphate dehydratase
MARTQTEKELRRLLCEFLRLFYEKGWVAGTGGGICSMTKEGTMLLAPTGVHKERVGPQDFFVVDRSTGEVRRSPKNRSLRPSECNSIFCAIMNRRGAGSVMHSHALSAVLSADLAGAGDHLMIQGFEMLKGIRGVSNTDRHPVAVIRNTAREPDLVKQIEEALDRRECAAACAVLVRDHGAYIWGADAWEAKRHAEVYHFLFEAVAARRPNAIPAV